MIFDDIADVMSQYTVKEIVKKTRLSKDRVYALRYGCTFNLDYNIEEALGLLGYRIKLEKISGNPDNESVTMRVGK